MRSLILHANRFESRVNEPSTRPGGIVPDQKIRAIEVMEDCLLVFYCVEKQDTLEQASQLFEEILRCCANVKAENVLLAPFVHLSNNIASGHVVKKMHSYILDYMSTTPLKVMSSHFGYHKSWLLDIKGHRCAYKYREFLPKQQTIQENIMKPTGVEI